MAVDQEKGAGSQARVHCKGFAGIELDQHEALPIGAVCMTFRLDAVEKRLPELKNILHVHADNKRLGGGHEGVGEDNIFELVGAGGKDRGTFVDFRRIEEIEDRKVLNLEDFVHAFKAKAAFPVEEV